MIKFLLKAIIIVLCLLILIPLVRLLIWAVTAIFGGMMTSEADMGLVFCIGCVIVIIVCLRYLFSD